MRRNVGLASAGLIAMLLAGRSHPAQAQLSFDVGIDKHTIDLIQSLPPEIRQQTILLLQQALPLIDASVFGYLDKVNDIITTQLDQAACTADGVAATLGAVAKNTATLGAIPISPFTTIKSDYEAIRSSDTRSKTADEYAAQYANIVYRISVLQCQAKISPAAMEATTLQAQVLPIFRLWYRIQGTCTNLTNCYDKVWTDTHNLLASADKRDLDAAQASAIMAPITHLEQPSVFYWHFNSTPWENEMVQMVYVTDGVNLATIIRHTRAATALNQASAALTRAQFDYNVAITKTHRYDENANAAAMNADSMVGGECQQMSVSGATALSLDATVEPAVNHMTAACAAIVTSAQQNSAQASAWRQEAIKIRILQEYHMQKRYNPNAY